MGVETKIDWCDSTWNPITGCLHGCEYCYARNIANRFGARWENLCEKNIHELDQPARGVRCGKTKSDIMPYPFGFEPTFHRYMLDRPKKWKKPRNIFVCSMADLFGSWLPDKWIQDVFNACKEAPQHNYLFLTKNPHRYYEYAKGINLLPENENFWYGYSTTGEKRTGFSSTCHNTFVSIEPILSDMDDSMIYGIYPTFGKDMMFGILQNDWVIIGAETGNRKGKVIPKRIWIEKIVNACREHGVPVFMKESLSNVWGDVLIQEFPKGLNKMTVKYAKKEE